MKKYHSWLNRSLGFNLSSFRSSKDLRYRFAKLDEGCKDIIFMVVMVIPWCGIRSQGVGPMFNPNPAFLLVQKLRSAPRALH